MYQQLKKFYKETGIKLSVKDGKPYYSGYLVLSGTAITSLPDNLTVGSSLYLRGPGITSLPNNLTVRDSLCLECTGITTLPENLTVGGSLYLIDAAITTLPENLTVGVSLALSGSAITTLPENLTVGCTLDLRCTAITALPSNLTVGEYLDLEYMGITSLPDNLTVCGGLYLGGTGITSLPNNLTVGGVIRLDGTGITDTSKVNRTIPQMLTWQNGKYIKVDGVFSECISHKGNVYRTRQIGSDKIQYLVTDGKGKWAHGDTLKEAKEDLVYKISNRDKSQYKNLTLDSVLTFKEAIECYRVITGACGVGIKMFVKNNNSVVKDKYTIAEMIKIAEHRYGGTIFKNFFNK